MHTLTSARADGAAGNRDVKTRVHERQGPLHQRLVYKPAALTDNS
jgi:hypothetical protein